MNNLIIIGFKSAGKTTLGRSVALQLKKPFIDTDELLDEPPRQLYEKEGEQALRSQEQKALQSLASLSGHVIATGGGVVCDESSGPFLRHLGTVIHLHTPQEIIRERIFSSTLPAFLQGANPLSQFESLYQNRLTLYKAIAHHTIVTEEQLWEVIRSDPFSAS